MKNTVLREIAHSFIAEHAKRNGVFWDATAGNGHDTLFLCALAPSSIVISTDIQEAALNSTRRLLEKHLAGPSCSAPLPLLKTMRGILPLLSIGKLDGGKRPWKLKGTAGNALLLEFGHMDYSDLPDEAFLDGCMFNLGYLPGSDKSIKTSARSTITAVSEIYKRVRPSGFMTVHCYTGHEGGREETEAVSMFLHSVKYTEAEITCCSQFNKERGEEYLFLLRKRS